MSKHTSLLLVAALASFGLFAIAQETVPKVKVEPMQPTSPTSGQQMYAAYCASCHGPDGKGNGPAAPALKRQPTDLTLLSQKNGGLFPADQIRAVLKFGVHNPAHGSLDMPVWGDLFKTLPGAGPNADMVVSQRIMNLTNYIRGLQQK